MAVREILVWPDPRLKVVSVPVPAVDDRIRRLCDDMADTMYASNGVGLAAPQLGEAIRVICMDVDQRAKDDDAQEDGQEAAPEDDKSLDGQHGEKSKGLFWLINPVIRVADGEHYTYSEGCLSVPDEFEEITRPGHVVVDYLDRDGKPHTLEATDCLLSVCLQHEFDHLEGKLFVDYLSGLKRELIKRRMKKLKAARAAEKKGDAAVF